MDENKAGSVKTSRQCKKKISNLKDLYKRPTIIIKLAQVRYTARILISMMKFWPLVRL